MAINAITAPYRFIPISAWVHEPAWKDQVSVDRPFKDGVSGWLDIEIEAKTPILVGGEPKKEADGINHVHFFKLPDGRTYAIPGSGLRGAIRSVLEIAAFGRAAFVDDRAYGIRDLTSGGRSMYGTRLTSGGGKAPVRYHVEAGWLMSVVGPDGTDRLVIQPCRWAKVHVTELAAMSKTPLQRWEGVPAGGGAPARGHSAEERYALWDSGGEPLDQTLHVEGTDGPHPHRNGSLHIHYRRAHPSAVPGGTAEPGTIVLTGKPSYGAANAPGKKKFEFFFYAPEPNQAKWLDAAPVWDDFRLIHEPQAGQAGGTGNASWPFWKDRAFTKGKPVPVFYIEDDAGGVASFGLAMMFRLAHAAKTSDLLANASPEHLARDGRDHTTLLFGRLPEAGTDALTGLKGRVAFEPAVAQGRPEEMIMGPTVLGSPKAQFYPAYVKQPTGGDGKLRGGTYASYTPLPSAGEALVKRPELAGRKLYPARPDEAVPGPGQASEDMQVVLHPLERGTRFRGRVRFHNLKREELGALVFALRLWAEGWGQRPDLRHRLGMGKPYGLGEAHIDIIGALIERNRPSSGKRDFPAKGATREEDTEQAERDVKAALECSDDFVKEMDGAYKNAQPKKNASWQQSEQIELLLAMADPSKAKPADLVYPVLSPEQGRNDFQDAKKDGLVLPAYPRRSATTSGGDPGAVTDDQAFPRPSSEPGGQSGSGSPRPPRGGGGPAPGARLRDIEENLPVTFVKASTRAGFAIVRYDGDYV